MRKPMRKSSSRSAVSLASVVYPAHAVAGSHLFDAAGRSLAPIVCRYGLFCFIFLLRGIPPIFCRLRLGSAPGCLAYPRLTKRLLRFMIDAAVPCVIVQPTPCMVEDMLYMSWRGLAAISYESAMRSGKCAELQNYHAGGCASDGRKACSA